MSNGWMDYDEVDFYLTRPLSMTENEAFRRLSGVISLIQCESRRVTMLSRLTDDSPWDSV